VFLPFDLHSAVVFGSHMPCRARAVPMSHHDNAVLKATSQVRGIARHGMCELASAVQRWHVGDLPAFGFFRLLSGVPRRLLPQKHANLRCSFRYFRLPRGFSRRTRHCRRMAWARHGMCELTRQGNGMVYVN
jgi:hypothetical protein